MQHRGLTLGFRHIWDEAGKSPGQKPTRDKEGAWLLAQTHHGGGTHSRQQEWGHKGALFAIKSHKRSTDCCLCSHTRVKGNALFGKPPYPSPYLQPSPASWRGICKRKLNRKGAVKCNALAARRWWMVCQSQLGTVVGQPKMCYSPKLSVTGIPDTCTGCHVVELKDLSTGNV